MVSGIAEAIATASGLSSGGFEHKLGIKGSPIVEYAKQQIAFGESIIDLQGIPFKLADMQTGAATARECSTKPARWQMPTRCPPTSGCRVRWRRRLRPTTR